MTVNSRSSATIAKEPKTAFYRYFLIFIAGVGGLLYGIDVGIIAAALLYLGKTVNLTVAQTSIIVAAVLGGSMLSSPAGGVLADWFGRKKIMILSGVMFVASVVIIVVSQGFIPLFLGRLLQGLSGGIIAVVVPLYLAETLDANMRGRGTAIFQFMLTFGIVMASLIGFYYTHQAEAAIAAAAGDATRILAAENHAWRGMFLAVVFPGILFFVGSFFLSETPRWLFRRGRSADALRALRRSTSEEEAELELAEMQAIANESKEKAAATESGSLLHRKYIIPFVLACVILTLNQTTGINSVLAFLVIILKQAGMTATHATQGDLVVKVLNCVMTLVAVALVDRKGRKFLLRLGTGGIVLAFLAAGALFYGFESKHVDVKARVQAAVRGNRVDMPVDSGTLGAGPAGRTMVLSVLYNYGHGDHMATILTDTPQPVLEIAPEPDHKDAPLTIERARYGPVPPPSTGWLITLCLAVFISCYGAGPGVVVWLTLSELMPTRIRSMGMGIALLLNQGASALIAGVFLPVVGRYGYYAMFLFWGGCTVFYFLTATFYLPETKGKTLEEIELYFEGARP